MPKRSLKNLGSTFSPAPTLESLSRTNPVEPYRRTYVHFVRKVGRGSSRRSYALDRFEQTYRKIASLARQRGFAYASQDRLAEYLGCSVRTVKRHISRLKVAGYIRVERPDRSGQNEIYVVGPYIRTVSRGHIGPSDVPSKQANMAPRSVPSNKETVLRQEDNNTARPSDADGLLLKLTERGVSLPAASQLVSNYDRSDIEAQLAILEWRKPRDPASTLVASIRGKWDRPPSLLDELARQEKKAASEAAQRAERVRDDEEAARATKARSDAEERLAAIPADERATLEARIRAEIREKSFIQPSPHVLKIMVEYRLLKAVAPEYNLHMRRAA